jgi:hypothetical protein
MYSSNTPSYAAPYGHDDFHIVTANDTDVFVDEGTGCCEQVLDYTAMPDACTNEVREERLILRQQKKKDDFDNRIWLHRFVERERNLLIACVVLVVLLNLKYGRYILYPFLMFSTWVHEMCHAFAALFMGGTVNKINVFRDGGGLAYTAVSHSWKRGFVASGGYPGTSVTGCILLLFRRTTLGPTIGTIGLGAIMVLSCAVWVRNVWGFWFLLIEGIMFMLLGWKLPAHFLDNLYAFLAAACCLNAFESIQHLFATDDYVVGGEEVTSSDAHTVADKWGMDYRFWAILWLVMSGGLTAIGIIFAFNARQNHFMKGQNKDTKEPNRSAVRNEIIDADVVPAGNTSAAAPAPSAPVWSPSMEAGEPYSADGEPEKPATKHKKKRNWFGFGKKKNLQDATLY